ncbi:dihydroorotate dehydrogenase, mitochondrial [Tanacetum coccineum]|uniref:Dihydroorotate dehydrogenase (quinone), mitochondrial n=1 Tax=Tanacetum coccineum TaxID=301880 RepID=A0ABQ5DXC0_9ASTR
MLVAIETADRTPRPTSAFTRKLFSNMRLKWAGEEIPLTPPMLAIAAAPLGWLFNATKVVNPFFALLDPEVAHRLAVTAAYRGWVPRERKPDPQVLGLEVWGRRFSNPIGLSAGFDKNAKAVEGLLALGFGFVEVGSITPIPQEGNPKPRIFRLREQGALINRCGFNSEGIVAVAKRLGAQHGKRKLAETSSTSTSSNDEVKQGGKAGPGILGVNIGKNKSSEDAAADYVINISSPNTPGLRQLQGRKQLKDLVKKVQAASDEIQWAEEGPPPLLVKIAPDLSKQDLEDIAAVTLALRLDGLETQGQIRPCKHQMETGLECIMEVELSFKVVPLCRIDGARTAIVFVTIIRLPPWSRESIRTYLGDTSNKNQVTEGYRKYIEHPVGNYVVPLRSDTIRLVQNGCSFHGLRSEDPNQHLKDFLKLVDSLDLDGGNRERTRLCLFQFYLRDQASNWLERLPAGSITPRQWRKLGNAT